MDKPFVFVLFGATGDLAVKKIFPALQALCREGALGGDPRIIATGRRDWNDEGFASFLRQGGTFDDGFVSKVSYVKIDVDAGTGYAELADKIAGNAEGAIFYSSLAPNFHAPVAQGLHDVGLISRGRGKLLIEKPFGTDEKSAKSLDRVLEGFLDEGQIFRVDHYLGKDTLRAVMDLHESTPELARLISNESVESIRVALFEEKGIDGRGASYDGMGAFRDVGQNHILEALAVIAAEPSVRAASWQSARAKALKRLAPPAKTCELSRRGQYEGYGNEKGVDPGSETETAFEVVTCFRSGKLKGVPVTLVSGKRMPSSGSFAEISFKEISGIPRKMVFRIQPEQEIVIESCDGSRESFDIPRTRDAYGNVILAATRGTERAFAGSDEVRALWAYADRVVACWNKVPLERYGPGKPFLVE
ncbi:MAG TPA: hypothetical protein VHE10_00350 [Candidatus Paceibacterota bacterium]|nr:hypothetical protein [Candidatus Paceibacterota bacterium]